MIRRLMLVNVALFALLGLLSWQLKQKMMLAQARENALLLMRFPPSEVASPVPLSKVPALDATAYQDAVAKNLFSRDRNPVPIPDPPPPPPAPPPIPAFPVARGVMLWEGVPPTIVLSSAKGAKDQHGYHPGDKFGEWKIVAVDHEYLTLSWNGQEFKKRLDELMDHTPVNMAEAGPAPAAAAAAAAAKPAVTAVTSVSESSNGMGTDVGGNIRTCVAGDNQPEGTIVDGHKKVITQSPFAPQGVCRWEPVR